MTKSSSSVPLEARYANCFEVGFNDVEFILSFGQQYESGDPLVHTRIVMNPSYVQDFLELVSRTLAEYRAAHDPEEAGADMYTALVATSQTIATFLRNRLESDSNLGPFFNPALGGTMIVSLSNPQEMLENNLEGLRCGSIASSATKSC